MRAARRLGLGDLDWRQLIRPGDLVVWGQASAEPAALTASLMAARAAVGPFEAFVGISLGDSVAPVNAEEVQFLSYCGTANNAGLGGRLDILPIPYGELAPTLARRAPVVLLSLAPGKDERHFSFGAGGDYVADLIASARLVIAQVSPRTPRTGGGADLTLDQLDYVVVTEDAPLAQAPGRSGAVEARIGEHIAGLIEDGSVLQVGLGAIPSAALRALGGHRDLGVHSGQIGDEIAVLAKAGVITNARKTRDQGLSITGLLAGGEVLMDWAHDNRALGLRSTRYTHDPDVLASLDRFVAINSAIEIDLGGQVNAEVAGGRYLGAVGGAPAFLRGAAASRGGVPIIALPSTAGARSRIVARLNGPASTARCDAGVFVTEHGVADVRGLSLARRRDAILAIADPALVVSIEADL